MPHKYEREIEEILRNMEHAEPRRGGGDRIRSMPRPTASEPRPHMTRSSPRLSISPIETLMGVGIVLALIAGAIAFLTGASLLSGVMGIVAFAFFALGVVSGWMERAQGTRAPKLWRGTRAEPTPITMRHRGVMSELSTQMRILRLKWRYWRSREH